MSYVKQEDILNATDGGLVIILKYYPQAQDVLSKDKKNFKIRGDEKTASATIKQLQNGVWVVTDFGGDQKSRNGIQVCMIEETKTFPEACAYLGAIYGVQGAKETAIARADFSKRPLAEGEEADKYYFKFKDFTKEELAILGARVTPDLCNKFNLKSCEEFVYCKGEEAQVTRSTEEYPVFVFDFGTWQKIYQPLSFEKKYRFRYAGGRPKNFVFGLDYLEKQYFENKEREEEDYQEEDKKGELNVKLDRVIICSGDRDALNVFSIASGSDKVQKSHYVIWLNSESDNLAFDTYRNLSTWCKNIYNLPDLDVTGVKQGVKLGMKYLDIKTIWLPDALTKRKDWRGNYCKDFRDFMSFYYTSSSPGIFIGRFKKMIDTALPMRFWDTGYQDEKVKYTFNNVQAYHFLYHQGYGRIEDKNHKDGFQFVHKDGNVVRIVKPVEIENFANKFLQERQMPNDLRNMVYKSSQLREGSLNKLPIVEIDFTDADHNSQFLFFRNKVWRVTAEGVKEYRVGEINKYIWEDKVIDHNVVVTDPLFKIKKDEHGDFDITIKEPNCQFLNYLINTSRIHWQKDLEDSPKLKNEAQTAEYFKKNQFNIAGSNLNDDEVLEQKLHLINKIFSIGYLLHKHKSESSAWAIYAMDNKMSEMGESHGGSGKSLCFGFLNTILKRRFYLKGRDPKITQNDFIYSGVTEDTDFIFVDDSHAFLDFNFFFSEITGSLKVNPKTLQPFEIPFGKSPKFVFTSNFPPRNMDPSTARRLLFNVFSDYYHFNQDGEYKQVRRVADDFGGKNLFSDWSDEQWDFYFNFCAQCIQFYLNHRKKFTPPMENITKRNLMSEMGDVFHAWADVFFAMTDMDGKTIHQNQYFGKTMAFDDFKKSTGNNKWSVHKFKKAMKAYCAFNEWVFNPIELTTDKGRILQKIGGKTEEVLYIRTNDDMLSLNQDIIDRPVPDDKPTEIRF